MPSAWTALISTSAALPSARSKPERPGTIDATLTGVKWTLVAPAAAGALSARVGRRTGVGSLWLALSSSRGRMPLSLSACRSASKRGRLAIAVGSL